MTKRTCCFIGCGKPADWQLLGSNAVYESVDSCIRHVGELLDDAPETRVTFVGARGDGHDSDCATHNEPATPNGPCDCSATMDDVEKVSRALCRLEARNPDDKDTGSTFPTDAPYWRRYKLQAETAIAALG